MPRVLAACTQLLILTNSLIPARVYSARLLNEFSMHTSVPDVKGMPECNLNTIERNRAIRGWVHSNTG